jgi:hypothetical protein
MEGEEKVQDEQMEEERKSRMSKWRRKRGRAE